MNSYPIGDLRPIGTHATDDSLTEEQRAFALALGRILAELWEQQQRRPATGATSLPGQTHSPEEGPSREAPSDAS